MKRFAAAAVVVVVLGLCPAVPAAPETQPRTSAFYPPHLLERVRKNIDRNDWGRSIRKQAVELAEPWKQKSDEQLWKLMFGATLDRKSTRLNSSHGYISY